MKYTSIYSFHGFVYINSLLFTFFGVLYPRAQILLLKVISFSKAVLSLSLSITPPPKALYFFLESLVSLLTFQRYQEHTIIT